MVKAIKAFLKDEQGLETVEWAVVAALIVVGAAAVFSKIGGHVEGTLNNLDAKVTPAAP